MATSTQAFSLFDLEVTLDKTGITITQKNDVISLTLDEWKTLVDTVQSKQAT